jgi:suppressor for copper-sensitivity B
MDRTGRTMAGLRTLATVVALLGCAPFAQAQKDDFGLGGGLGLKVPGFGDEGATATVSATLSEDPKKPGEALLAVTIKINGVANTYGVDSTSPKKTTFALKSHAGLTPVGDLTADHEPKVSFDKNFQKNVGKYTDEVTFTQRLQIEPGKSGELTASGIVNFLFCDEAHCTPTKKEFTASFTRTAEAAAAAPAPVASKPEVIPALATDAPATVSEIVKPAYKPGPLHCEYQVAPPFRGVEGVTPVTATFKLCPPDAKAGETVTLTISLKLENTWHTYSIREGDNIFGEATTIEIDEKIEGLEAISGLKESPEPLVKKVEGKDALTFYNEVTWTQEFRRVGDAPMGLAGSLRIQVCEGEKQCLAPKKHPFGFGTLQTSKHLTGAVQIGSRKTEKVPGGDLGPGNHIAAGAPDFQGTSFEIEEDADSTTLWGALVFAFIGGLTLNVMPCVLPVLAIKILSIVQQAGESRGRILLMNIVYTLGVVSVFALLATLAAFFSLGWGAQFQKEWFRVTTVLVVFVCGLNLLGVFEVLLPGMLSQAAGGGEHREGYFGAFMTGIFATLLATPCSTGYMTYALAWSVKQTTPVIYLVWCTMGLGMALPYLVIGVFPKLIRILPRPGMWMVQFKQFSAFAMFGAAVWFLMAIDQRNLLPVLTACVGLGLGLWMIGQLYDRESSLRRKSIVRMCSVVSTLFICTIAYRMHTAATAPPPPSELPWISFNQDKLIELRKAGKPILIDFTADWCAICKSNDHNALNTINIAEFVRKNEITTMVADFTDESEDIQRWLSHFKSISVPLTVVVPPDPNAKVIRLTGAFSESKLQNVLKRAMQQKADVTVVAPEPNRKVASKEN